MQLISFLRESLMIEGIRRPPTAREIEATELFLQLHIVTVDSVERLVDLYEPGARLRTKPTMNVRVGDYIAPPGGPEIALHLESLLTRVNHEGDPWDNHVDYEMLHPFTDGNGRSGRALWAWQMIRRQDGLPLGFLHQWYYDTLRHAR